MNISDFARERNVQPQTVSVYIRRHPDLQKHIKKDGQNVILDDNALKILDAVYPLPSPIEVIEDVDTIKKLVNAQDKIIQLQQRLQEQTRALAVAEQMQLQLDDTISRLKDCETMCKTLQCDLEEKDAKIAEIYARKLLERIFNKMS